MSGWPAHTLIATAAALSAGLTACVVDQPDAPADLAAAPPPKPATADGPRPDPATGYSSGTLGEGLHWIGNGAYMVMVMEGPDGVALVDAPPSLDGVLARAVGDLTGGREVTHIIYSHHHGDHIGAAGRFQNVRTIAHARTARELERGTPCVDCTAVPDPRPLPDAEFETAFRLDLGGGQVLDLAYHGPNHAVGNIFIHAPKQGALMVVDVAYPGYVPFDLLAVSADIPGYRAALDTILDYDFEVFVGGHVARPGTRADVEANRDYVADVADAAARALADNPRGEVIPPLARAHPDADGWWLTDSHTRAVVDQCARDVRKRWEGRLAGVATYADSHCKRMQFSLRID